MNQDTVNLLLLVVVPYLALFIFFLMTLMRYFRQPFSYSSLSSQFLESSQHFWGLTSLHYGLIAVLMGHFVGLLIPRQILLWNSKPLRLYVLEITGLAFALMALVGLLAVLHRRSTVPKARLVTSIADWLVLVLLVIQAVSGIYVAIFHPWGISWYASSASPYLRSLFFLSPDISYVATVPMSVKLHMANGWLIIALFPFSRLVHILVAPIPYLWRKPELVRWYGIRQLVARSTKVRG